MIISTFLTLFITGCVSNETMSAPPEMLINLEISSLNEIYPILLHEAQKWHPNSELLDVTFEIVSDKKDNGRTASAFFHIPDNKYDFLFIKLLHDETTHSKSGQYGTPYQDFVPISFADWEIDSKEALGIFFRNQEVLSYDLEKFKTIRLMLMRKTIDDKRYLVWMLSLQKDTEPSLVQFSIDANTGELLEINIH